MLKFWRVMPIVVSGLLVAAPAMAQQQEFQPQPEMQAAPGQQAEGVPLSVGPAGIEQIQQALTERGYDVQADGQWDQQTADAVRRFQSEEGLDPSGDLTVSTIQALGIDMEGLGAEERREPQQAEIPEEPAPAVPQAEREGPAPARPQLD